MAGSIFRQDVQEATGFAWSDWVGKLDGTVDRTWSNEQIKNHIVEQYGVTGEWAEWIALLYGQLLGRIPVGVTKDAGVQIGVRKTLAASRERVWDFLVSEAGMKLWIGDVRPFPLQVGQTFESEDGVTGKLTVVIPQQKLRMTWKRLQWDSPSRLQIYVLDAKSGKTTVSFHQEMLEDVYMREMMRRHWENAAEKLKAALA